MTDFRWKTFLNNSFEAIFATNLSILKQNLTFDTLFVEKNENSQEDPVQAENESDGEQEDAEQE